MQMMLHINPVNPVLYATELFYFFFSDLQNTVLLSQVLGCWPFYYFLFYLILMHKCIQHSDLLSPQIHVSQILAVRTVILHMQGEHNANVPVSPRWLVHHPTVGLNVSSIMIVHLTRLASIGNVKILVLDYVEQTPTAELGIIFQFVFATEDSMVIHSPDVTELQVSSEKQKFVFLWEICKNSMPSLNCINTKKELKIYVL